MQRSIQKIEPSTASRPRLLKVAAYARVSSGKDTMLHSLSAQVGYYTELIQSNPEWRFCGVYADEAMTGTKDNREQFQKMLTECRNGNINLIITKSISRFARNTVTLLETVRELKELGGWRSVRGTEYSQSISGRRTNAFYPCKLCSGGKLLRKRESEMEDSQGF